MTSTFTSLENAYARTPYPAENVPFIQAYTERVGIVGYTLTTGYIHADRADGAAPLFIGSGWANGFRDEDAARRACGDDADVWPSERSKGLWGVTHPVQGSEHDASADASGDRDYGTCPTHFTQLPATCVCSQCE